MLSSEVVKEYGLMAGACIVGIAASKDFSSAPNGFKPTDVMEECLSVIVLGASFPQEVLGDTTVYTASRNEMLTKVTGIAKEVAKQIKKEGFKAKEISGSGGKWLESNGKKEQFGYISLKHAAELAGLGVIGKNYLLTNSKYGNLLWLSAVLTDVDLIPDKKVQYEICEKCNKCIKACPSGALNDFAVFDRKKCSKYYTIENKQFEIKCYSCCKVCPYCFGK